MYIFLTLSPDSDPVGVTASGDRVKPDDRGHWRGVYGWKDVVNFAELLEHRAAKSPENLAFFGVGMYWKEFFWASGKAKTTPEAR